MKVVLVAYYYPPLVSGGSARPRAMARHLPGLGHPVTVVTHSYGRDQWGPEVIRIRDPSFNGFRRGGRGLAWALRRALVEMGNLTGTPASIFGGWRRRVLSAAEEIRAGTAPEAVVATYPPVECLELGLELAHRWRVPLVADFRDGLLHQPIEAHRLGRHRCLRVRYRKIEERILREASALLAAHPGLAGHLRSAGAEGPVTLLPNAFDPGDFEDLPEIDLGPADLNLVHAGHIGRSDVTRGADLLLAALATAASRAASRGMRICCHQVGALTPGERQAAKALIAAGVLVEHGTVDRQTCLAMERAADGLVLLDSAARPDAAPGKLFEYFGAGRPIVAVSGDSWAADLVREAGAGWVVDPSDPDGLVDLLCRWVGDAAYPGNRGGDPQRVAGHAIGGRMDRLAGILDQLSLPEGD